MTRFLASRQFRILALMSALILAALICILSLVPASDGPGLLAFLPFPMPDKAQHYLAYTALAGSLALGLGPRRLLAALLMAAGYGLMLELAQHLAPTGREGSWLDGLANLAGAATGAVMVRVARGG